MLAEFVELYRDAIIARCRAKVAARPAPPGTPSTFDHGVPVFLDELMVALRSEASSTTQIATTAGKNGHDMFAQGFTPSQVVHDYGDVCQSITEIALEQHAPIGTDDFRRLNRCLDDAIASAITVYADKRDSSASGAAATESERLRVLSQVLGLALTVARTSFSAIRTGKVGATGSTGDLLERSLSGAEEVNETLQTEIAKGISAPQATSANAEAPLRSS